ncbi:hypothetical protein [Streptomyces sp. NBC_01500]|uniref:hypothetical protein n=1 Tax=Streptomyces sp. NBC_01500 TaxID=2903886 RepID=UPI002256927B|nr:hypothetical protein [Streptomyces sp. NBC_01500]MCX4554576.1 hypothetical protein [Streptomyces sp. NBC_01500]
MIDLGVRVEFYEQVIEGEPSRGYLGAIDRTEGYRAVAVPAVGECLMAASLRVADRESAVLLRGPAQLVVRFVEHHLVPERDGEVPAWWDSYDEPGATVVVHVSLGTSRGGELLQRMVRQFVADGWGCTGPEGSELWEYGLQAREELRP